MRIFVPNSAHLQNIENFLRRVDSDDHEGEFVVDFHDRWVSVHPVVVAAVGCLGARARDDGSRVSAGTNESHSMRYLQRMGLFNALGVDLGAAMVEHDPSGRFIPLTQISTDNDLGKFIVDMVPLLHCSPIEADAIKYVISEMVRNVLEHANSSVGAFIAAQWYPNKNRLSVGVADAGRGVRDAMDMYHAPPSDREALRLAMKPGVTGTTSRRGGTEYNAGAGLFFTKSIAAASRNYFVLASGTAMFKLRRTPEPQEVVLQPDPEADLATWREDLPHFPGTAVGIDVTVAEDAPFTLLLDEIRAAYRLDVKSAKKAYYKKARFV